MKRAAAASADGEAETLKRLREHLELMEAKEHAKVRAYFARMPAALAALDAAGAARVVFQLRAELLQAGRETAEAGEARCYRDVVLQGSASLFGLAKALSAAFHWTPPPEYVLQPGGGRLPKQFSWCASAAGAPVAELRTAAAQKAVTLASVWAQALETVRYCAHEGRVYKVWCVGGVPRAKARGSYQLLPRCVGGSGDAPGECGFRARWRCALPMLIADGRVVGRIPWGASLEDLFEVNEHFRAGRAGPCGLFSDDVSQEEVNFIAYKTAAEPAFKVAADGTVSVVESCVEFADIRWGNP